MSPVKSIQGEQAEKMLQWVAWADNDYIAARQLLLTDTLVQGCILSNTAIEKYFKALGVLLGLKNLWGHDVDKLYGKIKNEGLKLEISEEYLAFLTKSYQLRYFDKLRQGFNIVLVNTKILVELDHTVYEIRKGLNFNKNSGKIVTKFEYLQEQKNAFLLTKNCYYGNHNRSSLFEEQSYCYELRVLEDGVYESYYLTGGVNDDGKFDVEGLKQIGNGPVS